MQEASAKMSFSFNFNEDSSDGEATGSPKQFLNPLDVENKDFKRPPKTESLGTMLQSLVGHRLSYSKSTIDGKHIVFRRELYDVKHQLMLEDERHDSEEFDILIGDTPEDLRKGVYEGGLKSWECSFDTILKLSELHTELLFGSGDDSETHNILELGCGTALPSCHMLPRLLKEKQVSKRVNLILSDYNSSVLRLVTLPNLLINWAELVLDYDAKGELQRKSLEEEPVIRDAELEVTQLLVTEFLKQLKDHNVSLQLVSGSWGRQFLNLLHFDYSGSCLLVSSETIYSPNTLPVVAETILELLGNTQDKQHCCALVAAKEIYFGVGGSVGEFVRYLEDRLRSLNSSGMVYEVESIQANLKRCIISIQYN